MWVVQVAHTNWEGMLMFALCINEHLRKETWRRGRRSRRRNRRVKEVRRKLEEVEGD